MGLIDEHVTPSPEPPVMASDEAFSQPTSNHKIHINLAWVVVFAPLAGIYLLLRRRPLAA
jgi:hypothetical protein